MAKIKLFIGMSLDGYIARVDDSVDWVLTDKDYGHTAFYNTIDTVIMGRRTYELMTARWGYQFKGKKGYVISSQRDGEVNNEVAFIGKEINSFLSTLRQSSEQDIWLVGGGQLTQTLMKQQLIDEMTLLIHPLMLGAGIPLFLNWHERSDLTLIESTVFSDNGLIQVRYAF